ncbi:MAG: hypothetical protein IT286_04915 [Proteobacteria bacterium]|nr:hypothetical protein [Pseudomonadota bacterium]
MKHKITLLLISSLIILGNIREGAAQVDQGHVKGIMAGAQLTDLLGSTGLSAGVRYWGEYIGGDFSLSMEKSNIDASGTDIIDDTVLGFATGFLAGIPMNRIKPHVRFGLGYSYYKDSITSTKVKNLDLSPSIGFDFKAAEHLVFGLDLLSFPFVIHGDASGTDFGGFSIALLNTVRLAYVF